MITHYIFAKLETLVLLDCYFNGASKNRLITLVAAALTSGNLITLLNYLRTTKGSIDKVYKVIRLLNDWDEVLLR